MGFFENWKPSNYLVAGLGLKAVNVAAGQPGENKEAIKRTINDITIPIFIDEAQRRKILTMKTKCKSNWLGNGFDRMVYELLFSALEELKIFNDTGHVINGEYLYILDKTRVKKEIIHNLKNTDFSKDLECYTVNEKELYNFLVHYKNKAIANRNAKVKTSKNKNNVKSKTAKSKLKLQL